LRNEVGAFPVWLPNLDELDVDSAHAPAFLILKSFKIIPLQLVSGKGLARVLVCLLDGRTLSLHYYYLAFVVLTYLAYSIAVNTGHRSFGYYKPGHTNPPCIRLRYSEKVRKAHFLLLLISRISSHSIVPI
jgi:hypothetical protein